MSTDGSVPRGRIRRTMPLAGFTARAAGGRLVAGLREKAGDTGAVNRFHERTAERYTELLGHSKGVLMKAGQFVSMVDLVPVVDDEYPVYRTALTRLQADAPPMDPALARQVLHDDLGRSADDVFAEFADEPVAAASIGQVHRATLHDGRDVAVKIQYPGVAQAIREDLQNTELLATLFRFAFARPGAAMQTDIRRTTQEISARISEEIDYRREAANIRAFSQLYRGHPFIRVPDLIDNASGDRVLTMTYLDGIDWTAAQDAEQDLKNTWAEVIERFSTGSFRHSNLFNADPHPGNYRFGTDGTVGFVDFGCVKVLPERQRHVFVSMIRAVVDGNEPLAQEFMTEIGFTAADPTQSADHPYQWLVDLLHDLRAPQPVTLSLESSQETARGLLDFGSPNSPLRRLSVPDDLVFFSRINLGVNIVCATLQATMHARSVLDDLDGVKEPVTPLGKKHVSWARGRGLPFGLDHHDQAATGTRR